MNYIKSNICSTIASQSKRHSLSNDELNGLVKSMYKDDYLKPRTLRNSHVSLPVQNKLISVSN